MEPVRHKSGVPVASDFADSQGGPIIVNTVTGVAYTITEAGVVVPLAGGSTGDYPAALGHARI
jgi:hypothetical protein